MKYTTNYFYAVADREENGKMLASVLRINESRNIADILTRYRFVNLMLTKKRAEEVANSWNKAHVQNGNYLFGERIFPAYVEDI